MRTSIKEVLMKRDRMTENEADDLIAQATEDLNERLAKGEIPDDICEDWFGLEPDYLEDLIF
jgi:uncharacterized membrane protein